MVRGIYAPIVLFFCAMIALASPAQAQDIGSLISPGELSELHKDLDGITNCTKCHSLRGGIQNEDCTECHKKVGAAISENRGYHAKVKDEKCFKCHSDHKGRAYSMVEFDEKKFDHNQAGYLLIGKHKDTECAKCHKKKTQKGLKSYMGEDTKCVSCHEDIHKGQLAQTCEKCHNTFGWTGKNVTFDHDKAYKLEAKHEKVECKKCHTQKGLFKVKDFEKCVTCHLKDDKHKGALGNVCESCHKVTGWKDLRFNHDKTKYQLRGAHLKVKCDDCHPAKDKGVFKVADYSTCSAAGCHDTVKRGNIHGSQFAGRKCDDCHDMKGWKPTLFRHDSKDYKGYKLEGKHADVKCEKCHVADIVTKVVKYKPIETASCSSKGCHDSKARGDIHGRQFSGKKCDDCHDMKGWKPTLFRHDSKDYKGYKLEGKHADVKCEKCHTPDPLTRIVKYAPIKTDTCDTSGCHDVKERGNIHGSQFAGRKCDECHDMKGWKPTLFRHDSKDYKGYKLEGKHADVKCEKCHIKNGHDIVVYKPIDTKSCSSVACHKDEHKGAFKEKKCEDCHTTKAWKELTFNHRTQSTFALIGKHADTKCEKCHMNKVWKPLKSECIDCHEKKDVHKGKFGRKCEECHTATDWQPKNFFHDVTGFELDGAHAQATCLDCHKVKGQFAGLGPDCVRCHTEPHLNQFGTYCQDCHTAKSWLPEKFRHSDVGFRLEGAHRILECVDCHANRQYRNVSPLCYGCHVDAFAAPAAAAWHGSNTNCEDCHKTYSWKPVYNFPHATMTFSGAHNAVKNDCGSCHNTTTAELNWPGVTTADECSTCHATDFTLTVTGHSTGNTNCALCHSNTAWTPANYEHASMTFPGAHNAIKGTCSSCHVTGSNTLLWPGASTIDDCSTCHASNFSLTVTGHTSGNTNCAICHSTSAWTPADYAHATMTFTGAHSAIKDTCTKCHQPNSSALLWPGVTTADQCSTCHASDFSTSQLGHGSGNTNCTLCHGNSAWTPANFQHTTMTFTGRHNTIKDTCSKCHDSSGNLKFPGVTTENQCYSCHTSDYQSEHNTCPTDCALCHNTSDFNNAQEVVRCD